jgi:S1-C subfamily serine protease
MNQLIKGGKVTRGYVGIGLQAITPGEESAFGLRAGQTGVAIAEVEPNSPGQKAGLQVGDVIVSVNGTPASDVNSLRLQIAGLAPGSRANLKIMRNGQEMDMPITLGESHLFDVARNRGNGQGPGGEQGENGTQSALAGVQIDSLNSDTSTQMKLPSHVTGVIVTSVDETSPAGEAGLQEGDVIERVNHQKVTGPSDFDAAVHAAGNRQLLLLVYRSQQGQGRNLFIVIQNPNK